MRLFERLNTAAAVLMVLFVIVAVNAYLYFVYYLPQTSPPPSLPTTLYWREPGT